MRLGAAVLVAPLMMLAPTLVLTLVLGMAAPASADPAAPRASGAEAPVTDISGQSQTRRPPIRVRIERQVRTLPPDAVRQCRAWYVQELRPSGIVVVPRMQCWWERG